MPAITKKPVKVQYRRVDTSIGFEHAFNLQLAMGMCVLDSRTNKASLRQISYDGFGTLVLNFNRPREDFFFGEIIRFEPGDNLSLLESTEGTDGFYSLTQLSPPNGHDLIKGSSYFLAIGNHVMIIEGEIPSSRTEIYLTDLLRKCDLISSGSHIILDAELSVQGDGAKLKEINEITLKPDTLTSPAERSRQSTAITSTDVSDNRTLGVLVAAGFEETDINQLLQDQNQLEVAIQIRVKNGFRRQTMPSVSANRLLRNIPLDEMILLGPSGRQKNGKIVKLSFPTRVQKKGSIFIYEDVYRALHEAYVHFLNNGHID